MDKIWRFLSPFYYFLTNKWDILATFQSSTAPHKATNKQYIDTKNTPARQQISLTYTRGVFN